MLGKHFQSEATPGARRLAGQAAGLLGCLVGGCTGPGTAIDNPGGHPVFVDGRAEPRASLPFVYYGTVQVDAVPKDQAGRADFTLQPVRLNVPKPAPAAPWLFPFDFAVELVRRSFVAPTVPVARIELPATSAGPRLAPEIRPTGIELVNERALQARISR